MELHKLRAKIPYKWRIGQVYEAKNRASCLAYIDARDVMDLLDKVVGPENWQTKYRTIGDKLMAGIGIRVGEQDDWVWKWDTGVSGNFEKEKSEVSDAFKRAAVHWGVGRFLYDLGVEYVDVDDRGNPVYPHNRERIWDLSEYINSKSKHKGGK